MVDTPPTDVEPHGATTFGVSSFSFFRPITEGAAVFRIGDDEDEIERRLRRERGELELAIDDGVQENADDILGIGPTDEEFGSAANGEWDYLVVRWCIGLGENRFGVAIDRIKDLKFNKSLLDKKDRIFDSALVPTGRTGSVQSRNINYQVLATLGDAPRTAMKIVFKKSPL